VNCRVFAFSGYDPEPTISNTLREGFKQVYVIWFKGQVNEAELVAKESQLSLYQVVSKP